MASRLVGSRADVFCNFRCRTTPLSRAVIAFCTACYQNTNLIRIERKKKSCVLLVLISSLRRTLQVVQGFVFRFV